jgi:hypothetical protein
MKQRQLMGTHVLFTIACLEDIIAFFQPLRVGFEGRIIGLRSKGWLPPELHALTNHAEADFVTLGGCLPPVNHTPFYPQLPERWETAAPPVVVPTLLESSADTGDSDLDADGETEVEELEDDQDRDTDNDSEVDETRGDGFHAAADTSLGH